MRYNRMLRFHDMGMFTDWWLLSEISVRPCKVSLCAKCVCFGVLTEKCRCAVMHCRDRKMSCMHAYVGLKQYCCCFGSKKL